MQTLPSQQAYLSFHRGMSTAVILTLAIVTSVFFGLVAATANLIIVATAAGLLIGVILLARPVWTIWLILTLGLLVAGVVPIWADALGSKAAWGISMLGFLLMASAFYRIATTPNATRGTPAFVWVAFAFLLYAVVNGLVQSYSAFEFFGGFKRYFQVFGLIFAVAWLPLGERDVRKWTGFLGLVALVQLPWAVYERLKLVPIREGLHSPGIVPIDVVAGTFGASLYTGGANADMATFLIVVLAFLLARWRERLLATGRVLLLTPIVVSPLFLGETKVVIVLLPLMFVFLYRQELLRRPHYALVGLAAGGLLTIAAGYAYLTISKTTPEAQVAQTLRYNVYEQGYGRYMLNRTTVLRFWARQQGVHDPMQCVFGTGLGAAHEVTAGHMATRYAGYGIGLTAMSILLWEQGVFGAGLFLLIVVLAWQAANRLRTRSSPAWVRADATAIQAALPLFAFYLFYRPALLESLAFQILFASLLGYLAWLHRQQADGIFSQSK